MGLRSKQKGYRNEIIVRDYLRGVGYDAQRVPLSGASAYVGKGDVIINRNLPGQVIFEVKSRRDEFKKVYAFYDNLIADMQQVFPADALGIRAPDYLVSMSYNYHSLDFVTNYYNVDDGKDVARIVRLHKYLGGADILAIKQDRKPILFLEFTKL